MTKRYRFPRIIITSVTAFCLTILISGSLVSSISAQDEFDMVILNGRVIDPETRLDEVCNVGIKDGRIVDITKQAIVGRETIDATNLVVAPGFIDTHFHSLDGLSIKMAARDGVTTGMDLEIGAINIDQWYAAKKDKWPLNYGTGISQQGVRMLVLDSEANISGPHDATTLLGSLQKETAKDGISGWIETRSDLDQLNQILRLLDQGMQEGALGLASTVGYMSNGVTTFEMFQSQKVAANYGRLTAAHTRFHGSPKTPETQHGFNEMFTNAKLLNAPFINCHNNEYGWWEIEQKLQLAREQGHNMWAEYYPYDSASTAIGSEFLKPDTFVNVFRAAYDENMYDPTQDKFLERAEYEMIAKRDPGRLVVIFNPARKKWMPYWLRMPHMTVASDSIYSGLGVDSWDANFSEYQGHPRTAGTRAKVFRLAREEGVPLMFTLSQMTYWPAKHLGDTGIEAFKVRGRIQKGMVADITIFDAANVTDNATYKAGEQGNPSTGVPYVIVNGKMVVKESKFQKNVWAGQPIRFPVESKGRFEPLSVETWVETFTIPVPSVDDSGARPPDKVKNK